MQLINQQANSLFMIEDNENNQFFLQMLALM